MAGRTESTAAGRHFAIAWRLCWLAIERRPLYDNHHPKGHHRHFEGIEEPYEFVDVDQLMANFMSDVMRVTRARR